MGVCVSKGSNANVVSPDGNSESNKDARLSVIVEANQDFCKECQHVRTQCTCASVTADESKPARRESMEFEVLADGVRVDPSIQQTLRDAAAPSEYNATPAMKKLPSQGSGGMLAWGEGEVNTKRGKKVKHTPVMDMMEMTDVSGA